MSDLPSFTRGLAKMAEKGIRAVPFDDSWTGKDGSLCGGAQTSGDE
jgi:hypothetical protein